MNRYPPRHAGIGSAPPGFHHHQPQGSPNSFQGGQHQQQQQQQYPPPPGFPHDPGMMGGGGPPPGFVPQLSQERFKLFVGKIAEMSDGWLNKLLEIAGPVLSVTRPARPMAFVEYGDPEVVLRALEVLNGAAISYPSGKSDALLIKTDDKVRARLDEYEKTRVNDNSQADLLEQAKNDLRVIADRIKKGESPSAARAPLGDSAEPDDDGIPAHLRDLAPEDLPEHHREAITSEIAMFREIAFKKAAEKKAVQLKREQEAVTNRILAERRSVPTGPARSNSHPSLAGASSSAPPSASSKSAPGPTGAPSDDPQSYNKPVTFVSEGTGLDDAQKERKRAERAYRDAEALFHERERRFEQRERQRINNYDRERARERAEEEREARERDVMLDRLARWDDEAEVERGRESFYIDRSRWRTQRRAQRQREQEADDLDRQREKEEYEAAAKQGDAFLDQLGFLAPPSGLDLKLKLEPTVIKAAIKPAKPATSLLGLADDDEEGKTKRALIPLVYDDDGGGEAEDGKSSKERKEDLEARIPRSKDEVFAWPIYWSGLSEALITKELVPFTTSMIVESLGFEEEELLSAVMTHIRRHAAPHALIEELEPVLDEETSEFVVKFWRELILRTELSKKGGSK
ncbi:BQ5605_C012g07009 [Microbotryum silenes-dioicae]|uniref:BQ5605_C012g07009 protein n=1 Tax=Microbotryum silenes-dioicae TaxID=796604 RepID=A0A2X0MM87_9BASI|nr:BQ5605_C012g07009 [Microbotryum silenes-dioicae]